LKQINWSKLKIVVLSYRRIQSDESFPKALI
jgi:hypothetical protein